MKNNPNNIQVIFLLILSPIFGMANMDSGHFNTTVSFENNFNSIAVPRGDHSNLTGYTNHNITQNFNGEACGETDTEPPQLSNCPIDRTVNTNPGQCGANVFFHFPTVSDNCPATSSITSNFSPGSFFDKGTSTVTFSVTDAAGNSASCSFNITVEDNENPTLNNCPMDRIVSTDIGMCGAMVFFDIPTAMDNCPMLSNVTSNANSGSFFEVGTSTVTFSVEDQANNPASCSFDITVNDTENPTLNNCPTDRIVSNDIGNCGAIVHFDLPMAADNCTAGNVISSRASGSYFELGTTTVNFLVTDQADNPASCSFNITVNDTENPTLNNCPTDRIVSNDIGNCGAIVHFDLPMAADNCTAGNVTSSRASGSYFELGTTTVNFLVTDQADNPATCSFNVTVNDTENPTLNNCPTDRIVSNDIGNCGAIVHFNGPTAADNCTSLSTTDVSVNQASGSFFEIGTSTVAFSVTDQAGNSSHCSFNITVIDDESPQLLNCPNNITTNTEPGMCGAFVEYLMPSATDNCLLAEEIIVDIPSGSFFEVGLNRVTYSLTDAHGNATSCDFDIIVEDTEAPTITQCPPTITAIMSEPFGCYAIVILVDTDILAEDNCNWSGSHDADQLFPSGITYVNWTVTDDAGNTAHCIQEIRVKDVTAPEMNCPDDVVYTTDEEFCLFPSNQLIPPTATDNCVLESLISEAPEFLPTGTTEVAWTAVDESGNATSCVQNITIQGEVSTFKCPESMSVPVAMGETGTPVFWSPPQLTDDCIYVLSSTHEAGDFFEIGSTEVSYFLYDLEDNLISECSFTIVVYHLQQLTNSNGVPTTISEVTRGVTLAPWAIAPMATECEGCNRSEVAIQLAPNPASTYTTLLLSTPITAPGYLEIYNMMGQQIGRQVIPEGANSSIRVPLPVSKMRTGWYQIRVVLPEQKPRVLPLLLQME